MATILIVEDEPELLSILEMLFEIEGFTVHAATDGKHALEIIARTSVDIVLTDLMMPRLDGLGLSQRLRESPEHRRVPIILHTAAGRKLPEPGEHYDLLIEKPSDFQQQLAAVHALLARRTNAR